MNIDFLHIIYLKTIQWSPEPQLMILWTLKEIIFLRVHKPSKSSEKTVYNFWDQKRHIKCIRMLFWQGRVWSTLICDLIVCTVTMGNYDFAKKITKKGGDSMLIQRVHSLYTVLAELGNKKSSKTCNIVGQGICVYFRGWGSSCHLLFASKTRVVTRWWALLFYKLHNIYNCNYS